MTADVPTLLLMIIVSSAVVAVALLVLNGSQRRDGLQYWAGALLLGSAGYALFLLRGRAPDFLTVVLANALLSAALAGFVVAVRCFHGLPLQCGRALLPVLAVVLLMAFFHDNFVARILVSAWSLAFQLALVLWALLWQGPPREGRLGRGALLLAMGLVLELVTVLARGSWFVFFSFQGSNILQGNAMQTLTFMVAFLALLVTSFGFVFMAKERADAANVRLAAQDALTGVANRRALMLALEQEMARALRQQTPLALLMLDIDHFKQVNDRHGHLAGDQVLRHVVSVVRQRLRGEDVVGRYGGEEFLLLLPGTDLQGAQQLAQQLCQVVQAAPCAWSGQTIGVTASVGIASFSMASQGGRDALLQAADSALYRAKQNGRNRVEVAVPADYPGEAATATLAAGVAMVPAAALP